MSKTCDQSQPGWRSPASSGAPNLRALLKYVKVSEICQIGVFKMCFDDVYKFLGWYQCQDSSSVKPFLRQQLIILLTITHNNPFHNIPKMLNYMDLKPYCLPESLLLIKRLSSIAGKVE